MTNELLKVGSDLVDVSNAALDCRTSLLICRQLSELSWWKMVSLTRLEAISRLYDKLRTDLVENEKDVLTIPGYLEAIVDRIKLKAAELILGPSACIDPRKKANYKSIDCEKREDLYKCLIKGKWSVASIDDRVFLFTEKLTDFLSEEYTKPDTIYFCDHKGKCLLIDNQHQYARLSFYKLQDLLAFIEKVDDKVHLQQSISRLEKIKNKQSYVKVARNNDEILNHIKVCRSLIQMDTVIQRFQ